MLYLFPVGRQWPQMTNVDAQPVLDVGIPPVAETTVLMFCCAWCWTWACRRWNGHKEAFPPVAQWQACARLAPSAFQSALLEGRRQWASLLSWSSVTCSIMAELASISLSNHHDDIMVDRMGNEGPPSLRASGVFWRSATSSKGRGWARLAGPLPLWHARLDCFAASCNWEVHGRPDMICFCFAASR